MAHSLEVVVTQNYQDLTKCSFATTDPLVSSIVMEKITSAVLLTREMFLTVP